MIINLTPHTINLNDGRSFPPSGQVARVSSSHADAGMVDGVPLFTVQFGPIQGLPAPQDGTLFIVSGMVAAAAKRPDVVAPATGHPDVVRANGQVASVPGFSRG